jgi:hypothetical protein
MSDELEVDGGSHAPIWAAFGDLMSVLLGAFVLILVGVVAVQLELSQRLDQEVKQRRPKPSACRPWNRRWPARWPPVA